MKKPPMPGQQVETDKVCTSLHDLGQEWMILATQDSHIGRYEAAPWLYTFAGDPKVMMKKRNDGEIITVQRINPTTGATTLFGKLAVEQAPVFRRCG